MAQTHYIDTPEAAQQLRAQFSYVSISFTDHTVDLHRTRPAPHWSGRYSSPDMSLLTIVPEALAVEGCGVHKLPAEAEVPNEQLDAWLHSIIPFIKLEK